MRADLGRPFVLATLPLLIKQNQHVNGRAYVRATHARSHGSSVVGLLSHGNTMQCDSGLSVGVMHCCATALTGV